MSNYRPVCDTWLLGRARYLDKIPRYGGYLGGFPERARILLGASIKDPVLHVCGGKAKLYPYKCGFGEKDKTMDLDPSVFPDFLQNVKDPWPWNNESLWKYILADPPYSEEDADKYPPKRENYPPPGIILKRANEVLQEGGRIGIIHYMSPTPLKNFKFIACVGVVSGFNNRIRVFSVYEKTETMEKLGEKIISKNTRKGLL